MKNVALVVLVVWVGYELWKNKSINGAMTDMGNEITGLKNSVMKLKKASPECTTTSTASTGTTVVAGTVTKPAACTVTGFSGNAWSGFIGQPLFQETMNGTDPAAIKDYTGYCYNSQFRKKPTAFSQFNGWH